MAGEQRQEKGYKLTFGLSSARRDLENRSSSVWKGNTTEIKTLNCGTAALLDGVQTRKSCRCTVTEMPDVCGLFANCKLEKFGASSARHPVCADH